MEMHLPNVDSIIETRYARAGQIRQTFGEIIEIKQFVLNNE